MTIFYQSPATVTQFASGESRYSRDRPRLSDSNSHFSTGYGQISSVDSSLADPHSASLRDGQQFDLTFHRNPFLYPLHGHEAFEEFLRPKG